MQNQKKCAGGCDSCWMPFYKDPMGEKRESPLYCSYCFSNGTLNYEGADLKEFQDIVYKAMRARGVSWPMAKMYTWMIRFAPRWRKK